MAEEMDLDFVTMKEAAAICRYKRPDQIRKAIKRRELTAYQLGGRHTLISRFALIKWLLAHRRYRSSKNGSK
jgi:excisionase family DNA binding protein